MNRPYSADGRPSSPLTLSLSKGVSGTNLTLMGVPSDLAGKLHEHPSHFVLAYDSSRMSLADDILKKSYIPWVKTPDFTVANLGIELPGDLNPILLTRSRVPISIPTGRQRNEH